MEDKETRIQLLTQRLSETDYKALKYAEGYYTAEEYEPVKQAREALRQQIRELENETTSITE